MHMLGIRGSRRGPGVWTPLEDHKPIGFFGNFGPGPLKINKAI